MNIIELFKQEFHSTTAVTTGAIAGIASPSAVDILTRILVASSAGIITWIVTKTISFLLNKFRKNKCKLD